MPPKKKTKEAAPKNSTPAHRKFRNFEEFYSDAYGARWPALKETLLVDAKKVALWNRFCTLPRQEVLEGLVRVDPDGLCAAYAPKAKADSYIERPPEDEFSVKGYYILDYASLLVVEQLQVGAFDKVLDMCAAPGGKSIAIAQFLSMDGNLCANEAKPARCTRLRRNLKDYVPVNYVPHEVSQRDAQTWYAPQSFTRVLVDAPCSSERHLLLQAAEGDTQGLRAWNEGSSQSCAALQRTLLLRALETVQVGGRVVYSTCSLSPLENDGVVREALRCTRCEVRVSAITGMRLGEATAYGWLLLPDKAEGWGPIYMCAFEKVAEKREMRFSESSEEDEEDA
ncbi:hypothetical protein STCU_07509 [Strigomonas culicis]|uniref:NOL1/NOP2/Sun domain family member 4 n=1 Tax=Strigomonas culicis TaxID=28005 RepID=S9V9S8_9TRYP|nr:hypothetical protein STCU_07509 [Strigomonas culicis]|eukprot:EPY23731.1 hypothetical protein STCU_07509 [Strigomonas culicis]